MVQGGLTALEVEREHQLILYFSLPLAPLELRPQGFLCRILNLDFEVQIFASDWLRLYEYIAPV
jgi:hypothetical protein